MRKTDLACLDRGGRVVSDEARAHLVVTGRVQGVFFRAETAGTARRLGLSGWVMNRADGAVEAVFEGKRESVDRAVEWARVGPGAARVQDVDVTWEEPAGVKGFSVRHS